MAQQKSLSYGFISRFNHWLIAAAVVLMVAFGLFLENVELDKTLKGTLIGIHKATGVLVLIYGIWRVWLRMYQGFPAPVGNPSFLLEQFARLVHWVLLAGIIVMPVSGLVMSSFAGHPTDVFGFFVIPAGPEIESVAKLAHEVHEYAAYVIIGAFAIHVLSALKHHVIDRDATLIRMVNGKLVRDDV